MTERPDWDRYYLGITEAVAARADCRRRRGALVVKDRRIASSGYNGAPSGQPGCLAGHCPRGLMSSEQVAALTTYDQGPGLCIAVHAEANALLYADRGDTELSTLYLWTSVDHSEPCMGCWRLIMGAGIIRVVFPYALAPDGICVVTDVEYEDIQADGRLARIATKSD